MLKRIFAIIVALLLTLSVSIFAFADYGDYVGANDYGGGGDYGGGSYGGGSYGGGSYNDNNSYNNKKETTEPTTTTYYSYKRYPSGNVYDGSCIILSADGEVIGNTTELNGEDDDTNASTVIGAMVLGVILFIIACSLKNSDQKKRKYKSPMQTPVDTGVKAEETQNLNLISTYSERDPEFSEVELKEKISNIYFKLQNAWQDKNLEEVRPYLTDVLYGQSDRQLDAYRRNKQTNYIERIAILSVDIKGWKQSGDSDLIIAELRTRIVDYVVNDADNSLVRGSKTAEKFMTYEWTLSRKSGIRSVNKDGIRTINCPNCGAPVDINKSAKCEYCGSIISTDSIDWVINGIKAISQRTVGK